MFKSALSDVLTPGEIGHQSGCASVSNDVDRISSALLDPAEWKPSVQKLDFALQDFTEELHVKRWKNVIENLEQLFPNLYQFDLIRRPSRYQIIAKKFLSKVFVFFGQFFNSCFK